MATVHPMTRTGSRPATGITDAHFDAYYVVTVDNSRAAGDQLEVPYTLTSTTADAEEIYGVLGNKDSNISATTGARDTLIVGGVVPVRIAAAYAMSMNGQGIAASTTAGVAQAKATGGKGRIVGGGTLTVSGTSVNIAYVDLDVMPATA